MIDAIIVGAGSGTRLGYSIPKAFVGLRGKPMFYYSLKAFRAHPSVDKIIFVVPPDMVDTAKELVDGYDEFYVKPAIVPGGKERWESVRNGVTASDAEWVMIHDAARPNVTRKVIDPVLAKRGEFDCVITATPEVDTVRTIGEDGRCGVTLDRSKILRVGTPQLFRRETLASSFGHVKNMASPPTDEAGLLETLGIEIGFAWGDPMNFKITAKADLEMAECLLNR